VRIGKFSLLRVVEIALEAVEDLTTSERKGGYLAIIRHSDETVILHCSIGSISEEKKEKYKRLALEKARRARKTERSSWKTRDPEKEQYGGGIPAGEYDFGFSGFTETDDEKVVVRITRAVGLITEDDAKKIFAISGNTAT
jgi:hypothetical protein